MHARPLSVCVRAQECDVVTFGFALPIRSVSESHTRMVRAFALIRFWNGPKVLLNSALVPALFFTGVVIVLPSKTSLRQKQGEGVSGTITRTRIFGFTLAVRGLRGL